MSSDPSPPRYSSLAHLAPIRSLQLLVELYAGLPRATPRWRAMGWAFLGALPGPEPGPTLMTFAGRPGGIPADRLPKDRAAAAQILRVFATYWPAMADSPDLQDEIARRSTAIVREACPAAATSTNTGLAAATVERIAQEWSRTLGWLRGWLGGEDSLRCWQGKDFDTLVQLSDDFSVTKTDRFGSYGRELKDDLAADGATPVLGQGVLAVSGWALLWTGFLVAFPYSARLRSVYLFNEKARGALSMWFLPVLMALLPFLRRRMLLPFRDDLLADARLATLNEREWYAGLRGAGSQRPGPYHSQDDSGHSRQTAADRQIRARKNYISASSIQPLAPHNRLPERSLL